MIFGGGEGGREGGRGLLWCWLLRTSGVHVHLHESGIVSIMHASLILKPGR